MSSIIDRINADHAANQAAHLAGEKLAALAKRYADARHVLDLANNPDPHYAGIATRFAVDDRLSEVKRNTEHHGEAYPESRELDISPNEKILAEDIVSFQRDYIRLGTGSKVMQKAPTEALEAFDDVLTSQINVIYSRNPLRALPIQQWAGAICKAYCFGEGAVDWSGASDLRNRLNALLYEQRGTSLTVTRITRIYDGNFLFLLKPDRHRFWTRSIALRDADDVLADLRAQGF